jgi:hypothetical protein
MRGPGTGSRNSHQRHLYRRLRRTPRHVGQFNGQHDARHCDPHGGWHAGWHTRRRSRSNAVRMPHARTSWARSKSPTTSLRGASRRRRFISRLARGRNSSEKLLLRVPERFLSLVPGTQCHTIQGMARRGARPREHKDTTATTFVPEPGIGPENTLICRLPRKHSGTLAIAGEPAQTSLIERYM